MSTRPSLLYSVPAGRDLLDAFAEAFVGGEGWVLATGQVDDVELRFLSAAAAPVRRTLRGRCLLTQLSGPLGGPYGATLTQLERDRVEVLSGTLVRARSAGVTACCLRQTAEAPATTSLPTPPEPARKAENQAETEPAAGWAAQAAAAARELSSESAEREPVEPERGDLVEHFAFGLCEVLNSEGDRLILRDLSRGGRAREIRIDMLVVHPPTEADGKRLFRLSRRG